MACVFPVSSRESVTVRCAGWATVTFGGGGGCGFGFSPQPGRIAKNADITSQPATSPIRCVIGVRPQIVTIVCESFAIERSPVREPRSGVRLTGGRQIVGRGSQQPAPVRALLHLHLD